jgi:hypothetical protein
VALQVRVFGVEATSPRIIAAQLESELNKALGEIVKGGARVVDIKISTAGTLNAYMAIAIVIYETKPETIVMSEVSAHPTPESL